MAVAQGGNILRAIAKVIMLLFVARMVSILRIRLFLSQIVHSTWGGGVWGGGWGYWGVLGYWYGGVLGEEGWPQVVWVAESA